LIFPFDRLLIREEFALNVWQLSFQQGMMWYVQIQAEQRNDMIHGMNGMG